MWRVILPIATNSLCDILCDPGFQALMGSSTQTAILLLFQVIDDRMPVRACALTENEPVTPKKSLLILAREELLRPSATGGQGARWRCAACGSPPTLELIRAT